MVRKTPAFAVDDEIALDLQQLYVTVTRADGSRVLDLRQEQVELLDEGKPQQIVTFARGNIPFTAMLLVDASSSMEGDKLVAALGGAAAFASSLERWDEAKLLLFADRLLAASPWTQDPQQLTAGLAEAAATGGTAVYDALFLALHELESRLGRRVVVLLSDGRDPHSVLDIDMVREVARRSQAQIFWVRPATQTTAEKRQRNSWRSPQEMARQHALLEEVIAESGGRSVRIRRPEDVAGALREIVAELRAQYALGYYPQPRRNDGRFRQVEVSLRRPGLKVRTRAGYLDL